MVVLGQGCIVSEGRTRVRIELSSAWEPGRHISRRQAVANHRSEHLTIGEVELSASSRDPHPSDSGGHSFSSEPKGESQPNGSRDGRSRRA